MLELKPKLLKLDENTLGKDFVVGDIHGEIDELLESLKKIDFNYQTDRLISCGDIIDRGPKSDHALDLIGESWFYTIMGNHEYLMISTLKYSDNKKQIVWLNNGGNWISETAPQKWTKWLNDISDLPIGIEVKGKSGKKYGVIHADYPLSDWNEFHSMDEDDLQTCLWGRSAFQSRDPKTISNIDLIYHGHNIVKDGLVLGNRHYIDNGAYKGNNFIILEII